MDSRRLAQTQLPLTDQERRVALAVGSGSPNKVVARELSVSIRTVEFHLGNIFRKLGIASRAELANLVGGRSAALFGPGQERPDGNLPHDRTSLIGRDRELALVGQLLASGSLVTLTGPGGVGKTRLAVAAARMVQDGYPDGVWFIELGALAAAGDVPAACAIELELHFRTGAVTVEQIAAALSRQERLLVLDNCEHVIDQVVALTGAMLRRCPGVVVLATSRERLDLADERVFSVEPMSLAGNAATSFAAQLFRERATAVLGAFQPDAATCATIDRLCARLDGLPLALELAAARLTAFTVEELDARLDDRFRLLVRRRDDGERQHSMLATVAWSYELLNDVERFVFDASSVFVGDFDLSSAIAVVGGAVRADAVEHALASLVDKSLIVVTRRDATARYRMLETVRHFGSARLDERGETDQIQRRHLDRFAAFVHEADAGVRGRDELRWHRAFETEWHNIRTAMATACALDDAEVASEMVNDVFWWALTRLRTELGTWADAVLDLPSLPSCRLRFVVYAAAALFAEFSGERERGRSLIAAAREHEAPFRETCAPWAPIVEVFTAIDPEVAFVLPMETQRRAQAMGDLFWEAVGILQEAMNRYFYVQYAWPQLDADALAAHMARIERASEIADELGNPNGIAYAAMTLGGSLQLTDPERALGLLERSLEAGVSLGLELQLGQVRNMLASLYDSLGRPNDALAMVADVLAGHLRTGTLTELGFDLGACLRPLAHVGQHETAAQVLSVLQRRVPAGDVIVFELAKFADAVRSELGDDTFERVTASVSNVDLQDMASLVMRRIRQLHEG